MATKDETRLGWIQLHERAWGQDRYPNRPSLEQMLKAPVLAFWYPAKRGETRHKVSIHESLKDLNTYATHLLLHSKIEQPQQRLARLFVDGRPVRIRGVRILIEERVMQDSTK